jgi:hypothetical protein
LKADLVDVPFYVHLAKKFGGPEECGSFDRTPLDNPAEQMVFLLKRRKGARS